VNDDRIQRPDADARNTDEPIATIDRDAITLQVYSPLPTAMPVLVYLVFLEQAGVVMMRDDRGSGWWRRLFRQRLHAHGPWDREQVIDFMTLAYGNDDSRWPFRRRVVASFFEAERDDACIAVGDRLRAA
jgi:hypothetical protein